MTKGLPNLITAWHATMASPGRWGHQEKSPLILQYWRMIDWAKQLVTLLLIDLIRLILVYSRCSTAQCNQYGFNISKLSLTRHF